MVVVLLVGDCCFCGGDSWLGLAIDSSNVSLIVLIHVLDMYFCICVFVFIRV